jgi:hypothetical protein
LEKVTVCTKKAGVPPLLFPENAPNSQNRTHRVYNRVLRQSTLKQHSI